MLWCVYDLARKYQDLMTRRNRLEAALNRSMNRLRDEEYNSTGVKEHMIEGDLLGLQNCLDMLMVRDMTGCGDSCRDC